MFNSKERNELLHFPGSDNLVLLVGLKDLSPHIGQTNCRDGHRVWRCRPQHRRRRGRGRRPSRRWTSPRVQSLNSSSIGWQGLQRIASSARASHSLGDQEACQWRDTWEASCPRTGRVTATSSPGATGQRAQSLFPSGKFASLKSPQRKRKERHLGE